MTTGRARVAAVGLFAVALAERLFRIGSPDLWIDEAYSGVVSLSPRADFLELIRNDTTPPLCYLVLRAWSAVFGHSEAGLRSLSALRRGPRAALETALATLATGLTILPLVPQAIAQSRTAAADWMGDAFRSIPPALAIPRTLEVFTPGALFPPYAQFRFGAPLRSIVFARIPGA